MVKVVVGDWSPSEVVLAGLVQCTSSHGHGGSTRLEASSCGQAIRRGMLRYLRRGWRQVRVVKEHKPSDEVCCDIYAANTEVLIAPSDLRRKDARASEEWVRVLYRDLQVRMGRLAQ